MKALVVKRGSGRCGEAGRSCTSTVFQETYAVICTARDVALVRTF